MGDFVGMLACRVHVIYDRLIEDLVTDSKHKCVDGITSKKFPSRCSGEADVVVKLVQFTCLMSADEVLNWLANHQMRAANVHELLRVGEMYPHLQLDFSIVELGSIWYYRLHAPMCVMLSDLNHPDIKGSQIYMTDCSNGWPKRTLFAAVDF